MMKRLLLPYEEKHEPRTVNGREYYLCGVFAAKYWARRWALDQKAVRGHRFRVFRFRVFRLDTIQHIRYSMEIKEGALYNFGVWLYKEEKQ